MFFFWLNRWPRLNSALQTLLDKWERKARQVFAATRRKSTKISLNFYTRYKKKTCCKWEQKLPEGENVVSNLDDNWNSNNLIFFYILNKHLYINKNSNIYVTVLSPTHWSRQSLCKEIYLRANIAESSGTLHYIVEI